MTMFCFTVVLTRYVVLVQARALQLQEHFRVEAFAERCLCYSLCGGVLSFVSLLLCSGENETLILNPENSTNLLAFCTGLYFTSFARMLSSVLFILSRLDVLSV